MDTTGSLLERLQRKLADLESAQRATGGTAGRRVLVDPQPGCRTAGPSRPVTGSGPPARRGFALPGHQLSWPGALDDPRANWSDGWRGRVWVRVRRQDRAWTRPQLQTTSLDENWTCSSASPSSAGSSTTARSNLVRLVTELETRGVPSPGGLSRVDWLRSVDPHPDRQCRQGGRHVCGSVHPTPLGGAARRRVTG